MPSAELKTLWVVLVFVEGTFEDTVCVSIEKEVAIDIAATGNANAERFGVPVEFVIHEVPTDFAFKSGLKKFDYGVSQSSMFDPKSN